ncbi:hypothetical protein PG985_001938 [Apiospora marii]|uniref:uncharacterized protein n=1 Tax=Apiospora marii TaxID=335849 RepID=UPI00312EF9AA
MYYAIFYHIIPPPPPPPPPPPSSSSLLLLLLLKYARPELDWFPASTGKDSNLITSLLILKRANRLGFLVWNRAYEFAVNELLAAVVVTLCSAALGYILDPRANIAGDVRDHG